MRKVMKIRVAELTDADKLSVLGMTVWIDSYATNGVNDGLANYVLSELTPGKIRQHISDDRVYVAESHGYLQGYAVVEQQRQGKVELKNLYVLPKFQGHGVGKALLLACQEYAPFGLWLTCWEHNFSAQRFYLRNGFQEAGEDYFYVDGENHRNIVYENT